jgi:predicted secreted protein
MSLLEDFMTQRRIFMLVLTALCFIAPLNVAKAQNNNGLNLPPEGQTLINLSVTETRSVPQDLLIASLRIEIEDETPMAIQKKINEAMTQALDLAKPNKDIKTSTGSYSVYKNEIPIRVNPTTGVQEYKTTWRGSQTITMESKKSDALLDLTGKIQGLGFAMNDLSYTISPATLENVRDELVVEALKKLQSRAGVIAKTLGKANYDLIDVNVDTGGQIMPMMKTMVARAEVAMDSAAMPAPVAQAGESEVSLSVSARALIKP